ncbi:MAG: spermidine synthase, partial [Myxococcaceae bacterium]|nr:spermidine synthase [Myxococcaceae bacterium]
MKARAFAMVLLFVSGATGLVYELVWSNYLQQTLGNSGQAHAIVIATFMGGLAAGAFVFGRLADRVKRPLLLYGLFELVIGLYAALYPFVHRAMEALFLAIAPAFSEPMRVWPKLIIAGLSLVIPTLLMGGTLPAMLKHVTRSAGAMRVDLARLYAVNSVGAALGVLLAGVWLVPAIGLRASSGFAVALNAAVAISALVLGRRIPEARAQSAEAPAEVFPLAQVRAAFFGVVLSGFTSMLLELAWIRLLAIVLGGSTYAFTLILTAFILGIGLGSLWISRRVDKGDSLRVFGLLQLAVVAGVCLTLPLYVRLPHLFWVTHDLLARTKDTWILYQAITFGFSCVVLLIPAFFIGAAFPVGARVAMSKVDDAGKRLGSVYAFNTVGTITGSLVGGLVLLPLITMERSFVLAIGLTLASASVALWLSGTGRRRWGPIAIGVAGVIAFVAATSGWSRVVANMSAFREYGRPFDSFSAYARATEAEFAVDFYADDTFATVTVSHDTRNPKNQYMRINGKIDASTDSGDVETQILSGHIGMLLAPKLPKKVMVIGAGAALTAGSVLTHDVERLDLVEISPAVLDGARLFGDANNHALQDPRVHLYVDDAKTFLALAPYKYDLIISVPSNPWVTGVSGLFTREFFRTIEAHLEPDGVLLQWVHFYESSEPLVKLVLRTLRETFAYSTTWGGNADLVMVSTRQPLPLNFEEIARRMAEPKVKRDLERIHLDRLAGLLAKQVHTSAAQLAFAGQGPINTDDHNLLEFGAAKAFFLRARRIEIGDQRKQPGLHGLWIETWLKDHRLSADDARAIYSNLSFFHPKDDPLVRAAAEEWLALSPDDPAA